MVYWFDMVWLYQKDTYHGIRSRLVPPPLVGLLIGVP